ncbi:MAG: hypothetical protein AB8I08_26050 [Sandaracinaceae bacterium]
MLPSVHLYRPQGSERIGVVSVVPADAPGTWLVRVALGEKAGFLSGGTVYGPYPTSKTRARYDEAIAELESRGYLRAGRGELYAALGSKRADERARAAARLGWRRDSDAVAPLLKALTTAKRDTPAILDALGRIGDDKAIDAVRPFAARKLLSRRRSGVEALRNLGDVDGLTEARQRGLERLPPEVRDVLAAMNVHDVRKANLAPLLTALDALPAKRRGAVADVLYAYDAPATVSAARRLLKSMDLHVPHGWRYTKSIYKRTLLRHDARTFGWLSHAIEQRARISQGTTATLKSGLDGKPRAMTVFSKKTQGYVRRRGWRYLRRLARWRPDLYARTAAEVLVHYEKADLRWPKGRLGRFAECYLLGRILFGGGDRMEFDTRQMRVRFRSATSATPPTGVREESFPELWDLRPSAYLRVAAGASLPELKDFAAAGLLRHPRAVDEASTKVLMALLGSQHDTLIELAIGALDRRFDAAKPDLSLLRRLLKHEAPTVQKVGVLLGKRSVAAWAHRPDAVVALLTSTGGAPAGQLAEAAADALRGADTKTRQAIAAAVLEALREPETSEGAHAPLASLARGALLSELDAALSTPALVTLIDEGSSAARAVAGALLGRRPEALEVLGTDRVRAFAESELVDVRRGAHALLSASADRLRHEPDVLFALVESAWADTRALAFSILRDADFSALGLDGVVSLCDSAVPDVRAFGREQVGAHFEALDTQGVLFRLVEHPARDMRRFAFELVAAHLGPGFVPLARIEGFCRAVLLDLSPDLEVKVALLAFLRQRGVQDERQAELVAAWLGRVVRTHTLTDFERVLGVLAEVQLAHPDVASEVQVGKP